MGLGQLAGTTAGRGRQAIPTLDRELTQLASQHLKLEQMKAEVGPGGVKKELGERTSSWYGSKLA